MLLIFATSVIVSIICFLWGSLTLYVFKKITNCKEDRFHFSILCILGISSIILICQLLSLFIPLNSWFARVVILLPIIIFLFRSSFRILLQMLKNDFLFSNYYIRLLFVISILLLLVMSSWQIIHPDTLGYHAQLILWNEKYKAVPGIVHLHPRFGFQSSWFSASAFFQFDFMNRSAVNLLNTTVVFWFIAFVLFKMDTCFRKEQNPILGILWLVLFIFCGLSYTQLRLTVTSSSPDFIVTLFTWIILFYFFKLNRSEANSYNLNILLITFLGLISVTIKLSALLLLLIPASGLFYFLKEKNTRFFIISILMAITTIIPCLAKNIISSGYPFYPSTVLNIIDVDWKINEREALIQKNYITSYARTASGDSEEEINHINSISYSEWIPIWWKQKTMPDKIIIIFFLLTVLISLVKIKSIFSYRIEAKIAILVSLAGSVFWFNFAPDPRFGFGFIMGLAILIIYTMTQNYKHRYFQILLQIGVLAFLILVSSYTVYRFTHFFQAKQWIQPLGIVKTEYISEDCNGMKINMPAAGSSFGSTPIPCADQSCSGFIPRGMNITDGFRAK